MSLFSCKSDDDNDSPTYYTITISSTIENGSVSADKTSAASGATITLTMSAAEGYEFESLSVTTSSGTSLTTTAVTAGSSYTFTMPESNVTVSATFTEIPPTTYTVTLTGGANATVSGGATTQSDLSGAMTTVTYTASDGYYFADFTATTTNGITLTHTSSSVVTVSGTPTTDTSIIVPDAAQIITLNITSPTVGQVIGSDGKNYAYASLPTGVTAVAKICYVSGSNGLALALTDEGLMNWSTAQTTCAAHTPAFTGGTWKLASKDEWSSMISAADSSTALRDGFSSVGGTNMKSAYYWSATESDASSAWIFFSSDGDWYDYIGKEDNVWYVRACLAF